VAEKDALKLSITLKGPRVGSGRAAVRELTAILQRLEQALKRIGQVLYGERSLGPGRKRRDIEELCSLYLVSWSEGSAVAGVELPEPNQYDLFGHVGRESLNKLLTGLDALGKENEPEQLPSGFDIGVLETLEAFGRIHDHGISSITFRSSVTPREASIVYSPRVRERVRQLLTRPHATDQVARTGRLEAVDGRTGLRAGLFTPDGARWQCDLQVDQLDHLREGWMRRVTVVGPGTFDETRRQGRIRVVSLVVHETGTEETFFGEAGASFWNSHSLEELVEQQQVEPVSDLDSLAASWPEDEAFDDALAELLEDRAERRPKARGSAG
jgi:hypothetical protein